MAEEYYNSTLKQLPKLYSYAMFVINLVVVMDITITCLLNELYFSI